MIRSEHRMSKEDKEYALSEYFLEGKTIKEIFYAKFIGTYSSLGSFKVSMSKIMNRKKERFIKYNPAVMFEGKREAYHLDENDYGKFTEAKIEDLCLNEIVIYNKLNK